MDNGFINPYVRDVLTLVAIFASLVTLWQAFRIGFALQTIRQLRRPRFSTEALGMVVSSVAIAGFAIVVVILVVRAICQSAGQETAHAGNIALGFGVLTSMLSGAIIGHVLWPFSRETSRQTLHISVVLMTVVFAFVLGTIAWPDLTDFWALNKQNVWVACLLSLPGLGCYGLAATVRGVRHRGDQNINGA